jgi:hypothetical protein
VFQGRYKDQIVQREGYLRNLIAYIALNPVRAGLVRTPELWPWSSYRSTAGLSSNPGFFCPEPVLAVFGDGSIETLRDRYVQHVMSAAVSHDNQSYQRFRSRQRILGDRQFKMNLQKQLEAAAPSATPVAGIVAAGYL